MDFRLLERFQSRLLAVLRVVAGLLFLEHATMKFLKFPIPVPGSTYPLPPMAMAAGTIELITGVLLVLGLFSRLAAFIASGEMAVGYFLIHVQHGGFWPAANGGEAAILYCFVFLYLAASGPGAWSIDGMREKPVK